MFFVIALFILVPLAELYVIFKIGDAIGWLPTIALLAIDSVLGWWLLKSQGRTVWLRFQETMQSGRIPHREVLDGALVIFGGAFLLLIPPTRAVFRRLLIRRGGRMFGISVATGRRSKPVSRQDWDVEGTAY